MVVELKMAIYLTFTDNIMSVSINTNTMVCRFLYHLNTSNSSKPFIVILGMILAGLTWGLIWTHM